MAPVDTSHRESEPWRRARLNWPAGLLEAADQIYEPYGTDISNITIIEGDTGIIGPFISSEDVFVDTVVERRRHVQDGGVFLPRDGCGRADIGLGRAVSSGTIAVPG